MIGQIIYGETCKGTLNYVLGKEGMQVLGYGNTFSQNISPKFFGNVLHFQGQRNATKNRYAHISLNLPHGEHLDDRTFYKISEEYMENMGYGKQPYVVVRHNDTKHEHVHIVTTNVKEDGKVLGIFNSYRRNIAVHQHLEKKVWSIPIANHQTGTATPNIPIARFTIWNGCGKRNEVLSTGCTERHQPKIQGAEFRGTCKTCQTLSHRTKTDQKSETGRIGIAFGLNNQKGYRTRFINGSTVHRGLSGPKLQKVFDIHSRSKLLPMHRKRLLKQIETTYDLFQSINPHDLEDVVKELSGHRYKAGQKGRSYRGIHHL